MTAARLPLITTHPWWPVVRLIGVVLTLVLLGALVYWPTLSLHVLWDMVIPLLPAVFLVNPLLWRNVCPLATLNEFAGKRRPTTTVGIAVISVGWTIGIALLLLMVPARRFLFNGQGVALAVTVAAVAVLAVVAGLFFPRRSGFCNSLCPVLPVEKLYGQSPLMKVGTARCTDCNRCTPLACIDLVGRRSAVQTLSGSRGARWLLSPFAIFAGLFPGFVLGYFTSKNGALSTAGDTYLHVALFAAGSLTITIALVLLTRVRASLALLIIGGVSAGTYYWFAAPATALAYGGGTTAGVGLQVITLAFVAFWLWHGLARELGAPKATC